MPVSAKMMTSNQCFVLLDAGFHEEIIMETWTTLTSRGPTPQSYARFKNCGEPQHFSRPSCKMAILQPAGNTTTKSWKNGFKSSFTSKDSLTLLQTNDSKTRLKPTWAKSTIKANQSCPVSQDVSLTAHFSLSILLTDTSLIKCHSVQSALPIHWEPGLVHVMCRQHLSEVFLQWASCSHEPSSGCPHSDTSLLHRSKKLPYCTTREGIQTTGWLVQDHQSRPTKEGNALWPQALQKFQEVYPYSLPTEL